MIFLDPSNIPYTTPPPLIVYQGGGLFIVQLDLSWTYPAYVNWQLEYATSNDSSPSHYGPYITEASPTDTYYNFINVNPILFYKFRYVMKARSDTSPASVDIYAGRVKLAILDPSSGKWNLGEVS